MARSMAMSTLLLLAGASLLSLQLLHPPPVASAAAVRARPKVGGYSAKSRPWVSKLVAGFLKKQLRNRGNKQQQQLGGEAASGAAPPLVINITVGTPVAQTVSGLVDITSYFVWAQCAPCAAAAAGCLQPPATAFRLNGSATFSPLPCSSDMCLPVLRETCGRAAANATGGGARCDSYSVTYGSAGSANTSGYLATDTFTFGTTSVAGVVFGCSYASYGDFAGASGVIGIGRGNLSLISQLQFGKFSYQLLAPEATDSNSDDGSADSVIRFGDDAVPKTKRGRSTPLLSSTLYPDFYYVNLTGVRVDGTRLDAIPAGTFDLRANGTGGVILSSTTPVTYLEEAAYGVVRAAVASRIDLPAVNGSAALELDLCYNASSMAKVKVPKLTLVFDGGADMDLSVANYFYIDNDTGLECLTMLPLQGGSVLGTLLQTGTNMIYDVDAGRLTFETAAAAAAMSQMTMMLVPLVASLLLF
uniref:Peptidase A1 domain-containing protein n=1 Tax=Oryza meridionalis TaxID=40149 RepID=A0A0E0FBJ1_9ORYZ